MKSMNCLSSIFFKCESLMDGGMNGFLKESHGFWVDGAKFTDIPVLLVASLLCCCCCC